jgi:D-alanyl-D-alanine carboxypeptidase
VEVGISREPYFPPGEDYHYSNTNFVILGMLIEEVTGNHLEYEIKRRILDKLGLNRTLFPRNPEMTGDYSHGYWEAGPKGSLEDITEFHPSLAWAAGAMTSNLMDLRLWALALGTGALLSDYAFEQQRRWVDASSEGVTFARYGLGLIAMGDFVGHEGQLLGFNTAMYYHPVLATTVIVLLNKFFGSPSVAGEMFLLLSKTVHPDITFG